MFIILGVSFVFALIHAEWYKVFFCILQSLLLKGRGLCVSVYVCRRHNLCKGTIVLQVLEGELVLNKNNEVGKFYF